MSSDPEVPGDGPPPPTAPIPVPSVSIEQAWELLAASDLGRIVTVPLPGEPEIYPVNYLVHEGAVYFRSAPGSKLEDIAKHSRVLFQVDGQVDDSVFSVIIRGTAERLGLDEDIEASGVRELFTAYPNDQWNYVRITADTVTGRRFPRRTS